MAKFSFHCQCYKAGQLGGIDKHNRRLNKNYISNPDIDTERSGQNRIYIAPKQSLYKDCKEQIEKRVVASGGRITKASNWICEAVFSYPEELPLERLDEYNDVFCNHFLYKVAKSFCRSLHLHFVGNCKGTCQAFRPDRNALQTLFNCYSTRYGNGSSEFSSSCACSLKYWKSSSSFW